MKELWCAAQKIITRKMYCLSHYIVLMMPKKCSVRVRPIAGETVPSIFYIRLLGPNPILANFYFKISKVKKKVDLFLCIYFIFYHQKKKKFLKL